jgi:DNA-binding IclR family transcriptional regulator
VETPAPLRFYLHPGSRVPVHCSASGKVFLAQMSPAQRRRLMAAAPLQKYTPSTLTDIEQIDEQLQQVRRDGYALDREEFLPGLVCVAVRVPPAAGGTRALSNLCVALQAPVMRLSIDQALQFLPALQRAAEALGRIDAPPAKAPKAKR